MASEISSNLEPGSLWKLERKSTLENGARPFFTICLIFFYFFETNNNNDGDKPVRNCNAISSKADEYDGNNRKAIQSEIEWETKTRPIVISE